MLDSLWDRILSDLERRMPPAALDSWLRPCRLAALDGDHLRIAAPNSYTRDWLVQNHLSSLEAAAQAVLGGRPRLSVDIDAEATRQPAPIATEPSSLASGLSSRYTFDSFV